MALLDSAQTHAAMAEKAGRAYDRTDPPTGMAAHEYYDKALRAAIDGPLGKVRPAACCHHIMGSMSIEGPLVLSLSNVSMTQQILSLLLRSSTSPTAVPASNLVWCSE